jgi:hypothetical protein
MRAVFTTNLLECSLINFKPPKNTEFTLNQQDVFLTADYADPADAGLISLGLRAWLNGQ